MYCQQDLIVVFFFFFLFFGFFFFFSSRRRHTRCSRDWSSDVCSSDLEQSGSFNRYNSTAMSGIGTHRCDVGYIHVLEAVRQRHFGTVKRAQHDIAGSFCEPETRNHHNVRTRCRSEERRVGKEGRSRWSQYN